MSISIIKKVMFYKKVAKENGAIDKYYETVGRDIELLASSIYHNAKLEGNTISYADTLALLSNAIPISEAFHKYSMREAYELASLKVATDYMYSQVGNDLSIDFINMLHFYVYKDVEDYANGIFAGEFRMYPSFTKRSDTGEIKYYEDHKNIYRKMEDLVFQYNNSNKSLYDIALLKLDFIHIHPYGDGNGRTSRLLLNWALLSSGYPPIIIKEEDRKTYLDCLNAYGDNEDDVLFSEFLAKYLIDIYKSII